jgi:hypothetical protein
MRSIEPVIVLPEVFPAGAPQDAALVKALEWQAEAVARMVPGVGSATARVRMGGRGRAVSAAASVEGVTVRVRLLGQDEGRIEPVTPVGPSARSAGVGNGGGTMGAREREIIEEVRALVSERFGIDGRAVVVEVDGPVAGAG